MAPDLARDGIPEVFGSMAWCASELQDREWRFEVDSEVRTELEQIVAEALGSQRLVTAQHPDDFRLCAARKFMASVRQTLKHGRGFALVSGLPIEDWGQYGSTLAYWLLSSLIARPVAQNIAGTLIYDVRDTGRKPEPGAGVRPDKTNVEQFFHNDNAYNRRQPEYVGLLCINPALEGGCSGVASICTIHNELRRRYPDVLPRLYKSFFFDRQNERAR